ncbi:MAG: response regulator [Candidatus Accumulibacter sp.]|nr:response regulator [Accumulibacter sp.]
MNQRPKILVVDDLATNRLAIRMALRGIDATIVEASNGFDALSIAIDEEFALILLDVQMPEMDGFEVCERLAVNPQTAETPVIFVTAAHNANEDRLHGYLRGATDYLSKPINDQILRAKTLVFLRLYQQNRALQAALEAAKVADRVKDSFLANVSHELRTPLNAVIGLSALALNSSTEPRQREYLEKVSDAGQTLLAIINDLLDLTKIAAGEMTFEATPFSLRKTAARALSVLGHHAAEKDCRSACTSTSEFPEVLIGDPLRIEQILLNLLNNAIKFPRQRPHRRAHHPGELRRTARPPAARSRGFGDRHERRRDRPYLPAFRPGRPVDYPQARRHRPGPGDLQATRRGHARIDRGQQPARRGHRVPCAPDARMRASRRVAVRGGNRGRRVPAEPLSRGPGAGGRRSGAQPRDRLRPAGHGRHRSASRRERPGGDRHPHRGRRAGFRPRPDGHSDAGPRRARGHPQDPGAARLRDPADRRHDRAHHGARKAGTSPRA